MSEETADVPFALEASYNGYLAPGTTLVDAIVTVTAAGEPTGHSTSPSQAIPDVVLLLSEPPGAVIETFRQVGPELRDLTPVDPRVREYLLGGWTPGEARDYHLRIRVRAGEVGDRLVAGRVGLSLTDGTVAAQAQLHVVWTDEPMLSTTVHARVVHDPLRFDLADAIGAGLDALRAGNERKATALLGQAVRMATESGDDNTLRLLAGVVDVDGLASGAIRLRRGRDRAAELALDARSTRTVRRGAGAGQGRSDPPADRPRAELEIEVYAATDDEAVMDRIQRQVDEVAAQLGYGEPHDREVV